MTKIYIFISLRILFRKLLKVMIIMKKSLSPFIRFKKHIKLCLHLARQRLSAVVWRTRGHHQMSPSGRRGHLVLRVSEEEGVPPGQLEPGLEDDAES